MKKVMVLIALSLGLSFYLGYRTSNHPTSRSVEQPKRSVVEEKLIGLSEKEIREYAELKDQKEKLKKADEIFGKILLLVMADLGIKSPEVMKAAEIQTQAKE